MATRRDQDIRMLPRLLETLMLAFDQDLVNQFVQENCNADCTYELQLHYGDGLVMPADPSQPTQPARKTFVFNNSNITKLMEHIHVAIPDVIFLIHDAQFLSKSPKGVQVVCKFSFSGFAIFDSDMDASFDQAPSPRHFQQLLQAASSIQHPPPLSKASTPTNEAGAKKTINFTGAVGSHGSNENTKRKFGNTVGKYIDSKHLDTAYEAIKRSKESSGRSRKSPLNSSSTLGMDSAETESMRLRSMSVDTIESQLNRPFSSSASFHLHSDRTVSFDQDLLLEQHYAPFRPPLPPIQIPPQTSPRLVNNAEQFDDDAIVVDEASPTPATREEMLNAGKANSNATNFSASTDSYQSNSEGHIPSIFMSVPRQVQSGGVLKIWLPDDEKKISSISVIAYCTREEAAIVADGA